MWEVKQELRSGFVTSWCAYVNDEYCNCIYNVGANKEGRHHVLIRGHILY